MFAIKAILEKRSLQQFEESIHEQIPFATALALTTLAGASRAEIRRNLPHEFVIRNSFTARGIVTEMAKATDWPNCYALVGSRDEYMAAHEDGGEREKENKAFAIPYAIRENLHDLVPRRLWPGRLLGKANAKIPGGGRIRNSKNGSERKPKPFLMRRGGYIGVYVRTSSTAVIHGKTKQKVRLLYRLDKRPIHLKGRHWLTSAAERTVSERADDVFYRALSRALRE